ncbi:uncharacterized protein LOC134775884 [Penaeus indicus]|uniref:uncharacterized protein LOC134775884 n=1 Tax=Penaeus indicus TaxID=29960 RepID=UPI00300C65CD
MPCSAITLSLATICAVVSVALLAIAFGTDNWQYIKVDRIKIEKTLSRSDISPTDFENSGFYRTRTKGLFRVCYPETKPKGGEYLRVVAQESLVNKPGLVNSGHTCDTATV